MLRQDAERREYSDEEVQKAKDFCQGKNVKDGVKAKKGGAVITVRGQSFDLTDEQLAEAAKRVAVTEDKDGQLSLTNGEDVTRNKPKVGGVEGIKLKSYIERIERLEEDKAGIASDVRDVFSEAKSNGFDTKTMRQIIKLRKMKANERTEQEYQLDLYKRALGMDSSFDDAEDDVDEQYAALQSDEKDSRYDEAVALVKADLKPSASYLQRRMLIGYNRAARLLERMEAEGIVSAANHVGKREVLKQ